MGGTQRRFLKCSDIRTKDAFEVLDLQSPPPHLSAKLKIRHKGQDRIDQFEISGYRKGKDKKVK